MENVRVFFNRIYDNSLQIQNIAGLSSGILSFVLVLILIGTMVYINYKARKMEQYIEWSLVGDLPILYQIIKIIYILIWVCAVILIIFGSINIYKGNKLYGSIALTFGLLPVLMYIFNIELTFDYTDKSASMCLNGNILKFIK